MCKFEQQTTALEQKVQKIQTHIAYLENFVDTALKSGKDQLTKHTENMIHKINETYQKLKTETDENFSTVTDNLSELQHRINDLADTTINIIKEKVQQIPVTTMEDNIRSTFIPGIWQSTRFPNAKPDYLQPTILKPNPNNDPNIGGISTEQVQRPNNPDKAQSTFLDHNESEWGRFGPQLDDIIKDHRPLPPQFHHKLVSNVRVPYLGQELTYTWYHTLRSAVQQYGILLEPVENMKKDKILCPQKYYGTKIDPVRYKEMADALYQLLALTATVSTEIRNIIHRHASKTDGYSALYEIVERIHPLLNADAKLPIPLSINCTDIHDYYHQLDSYFLHNSLEGLNYTERRMVHYFLDGLDTSFAPAVRQIRQQMRTLWRDDYTTPPPGLAITEIAQTVEQIMQEEGTTPMVRAMKQHPSNRHPRGTQRDRREITSDAVTSRTSVDIQCTHCGTYGHKCIRCDNMA